MKEDRKFLIGIIINIIIYFGILIFIPKIEVLTYEQYKANIENTKKVDKNINQERKNVEYSSFATVENLQEFTSKYKGETRTLRSN